MTLETRLDGTAIQNGDVSAFAGKNVELQLSFYRSGTPFSADGANIGLDRIRFIPEPTTWALMGCGAAMFAGWVGWRRRSESSWR